MANDDLPPSMFDGNDFDNFDYDRHYNEDVFGGLTDQNGDFVPFEDVVEALNEWLNGASGWTLGQWVDSITEIRDLYYDEETGEVHFDFDFDYDGAYGGSRST